MLLPIGHPRNYSLAFTSCPFVIMETSDVSTALSRKVYGLFLAMLFQLI
jgi:hypothetical protein